jgi:hypothetical protein
VGRALETLAPRRRLSRFLAGRGAVLASLLLAFGSGPLAAQSHAKVPWAAAESLTFDVRLAGLKSGTGEMQVVGIDNVRGHPSWHLHLHIKGSTPFGLYHVDDTYDSWMDMESFNSLRFEQRLYEGGKHRDRFYDIFPGRAIFHREGKDEQPSVSNPLDEASLFFFVRTLQLDVGKDFTFDRYFDPEGNPVVINVMRRDTIDVPAGRFPAIVLQPSFHTSGLFSQDGHAEIWLSDDPRHILLQMQTHFAKMISLSLQLRSATYGAAPGGSAGKQKP